MKQSVNLTNLTNFRLKLQPDERRSQQSSTLTGAGTIMVDQEFLFHVKKIIPLTYLILLILLFPRFQVLSWRIEL